MLFEFIRQGRCIICPWVNGHNSPSCNVWKIIDDPVRCQTSPTPCLFPAFPKSSSHKRRLIDMRVILQNTTNISRRPVDASIDPQDSIALPTFTDARVDDIPNKVMKIVGCIDLQYLTTSSDGINAPVSSQSTIITSFKTFMSFLSNK